nr:GNAT family N-acetyltransferase [Nesterenkonia muleiensis]
MPVSTIQEQVDRGEWHVLRDQHVVAALRVLWADPEFWGPDDGTAVYVHGLMVDVTRAGEGLGAELLDWAARLTKQRERAHLRLDSALTNPGLTRYYERLGFLRKGQRQVGDLFEVILWERPV